MLVAKRERHIFGDRGGEAHGAVGRQVELRLVLQLGPPRINEFQLHISLFITVTRSSRKTSSATPCGPAAHAHISATVGCALPSAPSAGLSRKPMAACPSARTANSRAACPSVISCAAVFNSSGRLPAGQPTHSRQACRPK